MKTINFNNFNYNNIYSKLFCLLEIALHGYITLKIKNDLFFKIEPIRIALLE